MKLLYSALLIYSMTVFSNAGAQKLKPDSVYYLTRQQIDSAANSKRTPEKPGRLLTTTHDHEPILVVVRKAEGAVEIHEQFDDLTIIRSGSGVLRTGFNVSGSKLSGTEGKREWLGGTIEDKRERPLKAGDMLVIPAMLGHQYIPAPGDSLVYYAIKVRHPKK